MRKLLPVGIICIGLVLLLGIVFQYAWGIKIPRRLLIGPIRPGTQDLVFQAPNGDHYHIVVGVPRDRTGPLQRVHGNLLIGGGSNQAVRIPFDTADSTPANWLRAENLEAFVVTWPLKRPALDLDKQLFKQGRVSIRVEANGAEVRGATLWLCYLDRWVHYKLHQREE